MHVDVTPLLQSDGGGTSPSQSYAGPPRLEEGRPLSELENEEFRYRSEFEDPPLSQSDESSRSYDETVAAEIRDRFDWFSALIRENESQPWGTAYRDFVDVAQLLRAVRDMGMKPMRNKISPGIFPASTGMVTLSVWTFIDILRPIHAPGTWRNKVTAYFRVQSLYKFARSAQDPRLTFENQGHLDVLETIILWVENENIMLGNIWRTQYGSKKFREQLGEMCKLCGGGSLLSFCLLADADYIFQSTPESR